MALLEAAGPVWLDGELHAPEALSSELAVLMGAALGISPACHLRGDALLDEHLRLLAASASTLGYEGVTASALRDSIGDLSDDEPTVVALVPGPAAHRAAPPGDDWALVRWGSEVDAGSAIDAELSPTPRNHLSPVAGVLLLDDTELLAGTRAAQSAGGEASVWTDLDGRLSCVDQGTLVLRLDGRLVTPSTACGAIRTAWRDELVQRGELEERELVVDDLRHAEGAAPHQPSAAVRAVARVGEIGLGDASVADELAGLVDALLGGVR